MVRWMVNGLTATLILGRHVITVVALLVIRGLSAFQPAPESTALGSFSNSTVATITLAPIPPAVAGLGVTRSACPVAGASRRGTRAPPVAARPDRIFSENFTCAGRRRLADRAHREPRRTDAGSVTLTAAIRSPAPAGTFTAKAGKPSP
jgi:hypothetical protein